MKITQEVQEYSLEQQRGMEQKSAEFKTIGGEIYIPIASEKA